MSLTSNISGDTLAVHLSDLSSKQVFTKTGYYKVGGGGSSAGYAGGKPTQAPLVLQGECAEANNMWFLSKVCVSVSVSLATWLGPKMLHFMKDILCNQYGG